MSNTFTIEDIHVIRYENFEQTKELSAEELINKTKAAASPGWQRIKELRKEQPTKQA